MPRLFTGLEVPPDIAAELATMRGGLSGARWIDAGNYHITLRFIGDIDAAAARDVHSMLERIERPAFTVTFDGLKAFGGDKPRAIVAAVKPVAPLVDMRAEQERLLRRIGIPAESRKFVPHVTLARLRGNSAMAVADYLGMHGYPVSRPFHVTRFVLYSSRDSVGGGPYAIEAVYPLP